MNAWGNEGVRESNIFTLSLTNRMATHYVPQVIGEAHLLRPRVKGKQLCLFPTWSMRGIDFGLDLGDFVLDLWLVDFCCDVDLALRPLFFDMEED